MALEKSLSADRLSPPLSVGELVADAFERGRRVQRQQDADIASLYPVFAYDGDTGELLRARDAISQAIEKSLPPGEMIR